MDEQLEVSANGKVDGPMTLDQIRRGVTAGQIPRDARVRPLGGTAWQPVLDALGYHPPPAAPIADPPAQAVSEIDVKLARSGRYKNLLAVSRSLRSNGGALKLLGLLMGVGGILASLAMGGAWGIGVAVMGAFFGAALYAAGLLIAAMGEGLLALADIAVNTAPKEGT